MQLFPPLEIGWLNGWLLLLPELLVQGFMLLIFPKPVVTRLFDRSGWSPLQRNFTILGKVFSLVCLVLILLTPLKFTSPAFFIGVLLFALGLAGLVISLLNFKDTPPDQPVTRGIYRISRHPQLVSLFFVFLGVCLAMGSWVAVFALLLSKVFEHFGILAEEQVCLKKYGESYRLYLQRVPRYLLFF